MTGFLELFLDNSILILLIFCLDHTTRSKSGYYAVVVPLNFKEGDKARLVSPAMSVTPAKTYCLTWFYHMFGDDINVLRVFLKTEDKYALIWKYGETIGS